VSQELSLQAGSALAVPSTLSLYSVDHASWRGALHPIVAGLFAIATMLAPWPARALPPLADGDDLPRDDAIDAAPHELWLDPSGKSPLWVAIDASMQRREGKTGFGAMLMLGLPLERLGAHAAKRKTPAAHASSRAVAETAAPDRVAKIDKADMPAPVTSAPSAAEAAPLATPMPSGDAAPKPSGSRSPPDSAPHISPRDAREAIDHALERAHLVEPEARIDALAARARISALLPELRLRVTRSLDESQTVSPTEYDPTRTTASGGSGLWLEARATFRLDRLVFADEEVALERTRRERSEAQSKLIARVLALLFAWQRAATLERDAGASPEEQLASMLARVEAEVELDVVTGGWFSRSRAGR